MKSLLRPFLAVIAALAFAIPVPAQAPGVKLRTVVIDPGHGGKDSGCVSRDKQTYEKTITLDIGTKLAKKIAAAYPDVNVVMTRSEDVFVELEKRAVTANNAHANLFISIHVNSVDKGTTANGYSIHCLGQSARKGNDLFSKNLDLVKRENSVIRLEDNYSTRYQGFNPDDEQSYILFNLMQNAHLGNSLAFAGDVATAMGSDPIRTSRGVHQDPFWVLWRTAMPSVLIEVGFITNPDDLQTMRSADGREAIADNLLNAFAQFKFRYDGTPVPDFPKRTAAPAAPLAEPVEAKPVEAKPAETPAAEPAEAKPVETPVAEPVEAKPAETVSEPAEAKPAEATPDNYAGPVYGTQILAIGREMDPSDEFFRGYKVRCIRSGRLNKYVTGISESLESARKNFAEIRKFFPDAYMVKIQDDISVPVR
ncbi:MAG: N-acetylmuramoyl-L-alanine amidase [Bacteroidales bacterium]|nr:N-acetylmuramoyl-L-alanine amidase [Bacteroidales bacterium]MBP5373654.1 N-acetylmuramoyl-L-alanine amidase [Bacteroidales bacterium]